MGIQTLKTGSRTRNVMAGNTLIYPGSFESIATITVGSGGASNVEFTSIPGTYTHLQIRHINRATGSVTDSFNKLQFNGDTGNNYYTHYLLGTGTAVQSGANVPNVDFIYSGVNWGVTTITDTKFFAGAIIDILDYANTNKKTTSRTLSGIDGNGSGQIDFTSGTWNNTAAVTSIKISVNSGTNFAQYSTFALYGIKG
jgi:hypothetical protein